jgi:ABC-type Zn uptake system ZnuABC Zn-binding protein ZnuA
MSAQAVLAAMEDRMVEHEGEESGHQHSGGDPHFWLDPLLAIHYVERIRDGLVQADPEHAPIYSGNADRYIRELRDLDLEIARALRQVPPEHRRLVSFHDAFGHFARRYGWKVSFFEPSDASSVTPGAVETVIRQIQSEGIPAIFAEPQFSSGVLEQAARDTGINVGILRSLCDATAPTYVQLMRGNTESLVQNLR